MIVTSVLERKLEEGLDGTIWTILSSMSVLGNIHVNAMLVSLGLVSTSLCDFQIDDTFEINLAV